MLVCFEGETSSSSEGGDIGGESGGVSLRCLEGVPFIGVFIGGGGAGLGRGGSSDVL